MKPLSWRVAEIVLVVLVTIGIVILVVLAGAGR
jgi:hypothetical protein